MNIKEKKHNLEWTQIAQIQTGITTDNAQLFAEGRPGEGFVNWVTETYSEAPDESTLETLPDFSAHVL